MYCKKKTNIKKGETGDRPPFLLSIKLIQLYRTTNSQHGIVDFLHGTHIL